MTPKPLRPVTEADEAEYTAWVATRPPHLQAVLQRLAPTAAQAMTCWRLAGTSGHYVLVSWFTAANEAERERHGDEVEVKVMHILGPGSRLVEGTMRVQVFGVAPDDLVLCGCGDDGGAL